MITRTLYFGSPARLRISSDCLVVEPPNQLKTDHYQAQAGPPDPIPVEDIGLVVIDHPQVTMSSYLLTRLLSDNVGIITCNERHLPTGMLLNLDGHHLQSARFRAQIEASVPLCKQLWKQTIEAKIRNQAALLESVGIEAAILWTYANEVRSGDTDNREAVAAAFYWKKIFQQYPAFVRDRVGMPPNNLLNYGYAVLRASVARALTGSGLLPVLGIHHRNQYNDYCLADDIMEPYRPYIDSTVISMLALENAPDELTKEHRATLLRALIQDVQINGIIRPLQIAISTTSSSLAACFEGETNRIIYPTVKFKHA